MKILSTPKDSVYKGRYWQFMLLYHGAIALAGVVVLYWQPIGWRLIGMDAVAFVINHLINVSVERD